MSPGLAGRVVVVTGGGKGLGRAFALHLAAAGAHVVVNNRDRVRDAHGRRAADAVVAEIEAAGGTAVAEHGEVEDPATADRLVALALDRWGRLDGCLTSAGINPLALAHRVEPVEFARVLAVNVAGTAQVAGACLRAMREQGSGRVLLVSSGAGLHGELAAAAYAASKGAVVALARTMAIEGPRRGVAANVLLPYATTQMTDQGMDRRYLDAMAPELVAPVATALLDPACPLNGQVVVAAAGAVRATDAVEYDPVRLPDGPLSGPDLAGLLATSRAGAPRTFASAQEAFLDLAATVAPTPAGGPA
ncbi:SDR family NAD(P)-dependent oxidoreductase [Klenkia sp. PcliD-1-E]|uniref:SDR family NAD(P)-dependent oxidoreductase n=1 Tax=Klenkia sp. PcliD-1-E TaxID=2954492 RepID=UPI0020968CA9|nr:SDR family NAD(P)-dependent oxidoreductase [Klenkia sp. PcliD-1-E]MCO7220133.1 SDR family NAD(P)-dependent oxidoreductase [Klenkia sp. PcliD-1-E]